MREGTEREKNVFQTEKQGGSQRYRKYVNLLHLSFTAEVYVGRHNATIYLETSKMSGWRKPYSLLPASFIKQNSITKNLF